MPTSRKASLSHVATLLAFAALPSTVVHAQSTFVPGQVAEQNDPYVWLEDIHGDKAMAWVKAENERSAKVLQADPRYAEYKAEALKILESPDRLAIPVFRNGTIYNTWQDAAHVRGIVRKTTLADYLTAQPNWQTVIDYDALAEADNERWVQHGLNCLYPGDNVCLAGLSAGGEDADTLREFDLKSGKFIPPDASGFVVPKSKHRVAWVDKDTLLIASDWGQGTMTHSGYPFIVKEWKRGQPLDQAKEVYRGSESDGGYGVTPFVLNDEQGHQEVLIDRPLTTFESELSLVTANGVKLLALPKKAQPEALLDGQLIVTIDEPWRPEGSEKSFVAGSVLSMDLTAVEKDPVHLKPTIVFAPTAEEFEQQVSDTRNHLLITTLDHVQGRAYEYTCSKSGAWTRKKLDVPDNLTVGVVTSNAADDKFFLSPPAFSLLRPSNWATLPPAR